MAHALKIEDPRNAQAIANSADWRTAVTDLLTFWMQEGRPFSSGEVSCALRTHRPELRFSHLSVGEHLRDLFYSQTLPPYQTGQPYQVPRLTEGLYPTRTRAGTEVFVYAPAPAEGDQHDFEVYIPEPGETIADAPAQAVGQTQQAQQNGSGVTPVTIFGAKVANVDIKAKVHDDKRLCVPRSAFELSVHLGAQPMRGGEPVYVTVEPNVVSISLNDPGNGAKAYDLSQTRGRVLFPSPDPANPFAPGDVFQVKVEKGLLTIELS